VHSRTRVRQPETDTMSRLLGRTNMRFHSVIPIVGNSPVASN
jgi:hypothetical protein